MKRGDIVQLKEPIEGRRFRGTLGKITKDKKCIVNLPNGLYASYPIELWEVVSESAVETIDNNDDDEDDETE